jgi:site-specific recombinase XerD
VKLSKKLSPAVVEGAKPEAEPYRVWDTTLPSLFLRVQPSGVKSWNVQWSRTSSKALGKWPGVTVESARAKARAALVETDKHGKPLAIIERGKPKPRTLREFIDDDFRPWAAANLRWADGAADRILSVFADFAEKPLTAINAWTVEKWRSKRIKSGVSANTCNRDLATLKSALGRARKWNLIDADPLAEVKQAKVDSTRVRYLSDAEEKRLRAALRARDAKGRAARARANEWRAERSKAVLVPLRDEDYSDHLTPAVLVSLNTGLRRGELTALEWSDINVPGKILTVRAAAAKSGRMRHIPLNAEALAVLKQWKKQTKKTGSAAEPNETEGRLFPFHDMKTSWNALLTEAKIEGFRWHDLRHSFASRLVMAGVNLNAVRELLGHVDLKMTLRYAHLAPSHLADAVAKLGTAR